jgi:hypothetical protein
MKKIAMCLIAVAACGIALTGCKTTYTNDAAYDSKSVMVPAAYQLKIEHKDTKVEGSATVHSVLNWFCWGVSDYADRTSIGGASGEVSPLFNILPDPIGMAKKGAVYNACKASGSDLLIGTKYEIVENWYFVYSQINCKVSGYPGFEKGVEKVSDVSKAQNKVVKL